MRIIICRPDRVNRKKSKMEGVYHININIRTPEGMLEVGNFLMGDNADFALTTFSRLKGNAVSSELNLLRIDLVSTSKGAPDDHLGSIYCTLGEYVENCKLITLDVFKFFSIEGNSLKTRRTLKSATQKRRQ